jgi:hypothetical protein
MEQFLESIQHSARPTVSCCFNRHPSQQGCEKKRKPEVSTTTEALSSQQSAFSPRNILVLFCPASFPARLQKEKRSHRAEWKTKSGKPTLEPQRTRRSTEENLYLPQDLSDIPELAIMDNMLVRRFHRPKTDPAKQATRPDMNQANRSAGRNRDRV